MYSKIGIFGIYVCSIRNFKLSFTKVGIEYNILLRERGERRDGESKLITIEVIWQIFV